VNEDSWWFGTNTHFIPEHSIPYEYKAYSEYVRNETNYKNRGQQRIDVLL